MRIYVADRMMTLWYATLSSAVLLGTGPGQPFRHRVAVEKAAWQCR